MAEQISFEKLVEHFEMTPTVSEAKWFGKRCLNVNGKAFAVLFGEDMAFKLDPEKLSEALKISGAQLFDPRGKGNPFKEWAQIPIAMSENWTNLGEQALAFVERLAK